MAPMITMEVNVERLVTVERAREGAYRHIPMYIPSVRRVASVASFLKATLL